MEVVIVAQGNHKMCNPLMCELLGKKEFELLKKEAKFSCTQRDSLFLLFLLLLSSI